MEQVSGLHRNVVVVGFVDDQCRYPHFGKLGSDIAAICPGNELIPHVLGHTAHDIDDGGPAGFGIVARFQCHPSYAVPVGRAHRLERLIDCRIYPELESTLVDQLRRGAQQKQAGDTLGMPNRELDCERTAVDCSPENHALRTDGIKDSFNILDRGEEAVAAFRRRGGANTASIVEDHAAVLSDPVPVLREHTVTRAQRRTVTDAECDDVRARRAQHLIGELYALVVRVLQRLSVEPHPPRARQLIIDRVERQ